MAASSYHNTSLPQTSKPAAFATPIPLRPMSYGYNELPPQGPTSYKPTFQQQQFPVDDDLSRQKLNNNDNSPRSFSKYARYLRIVQYATSALTALFTFFMKAIMAFMLYKFYTTKNHMVNGRGPWAEDTKLWPTWLLFAASGVTLVITVASLVMVCCSKKARKSSLVWLTVAKYAVHIFAWLAVTAFYRMGKTGSDLWGWSCGDKAAAIQSEFQSQVDFSGLCNIQSSSWYVSVAEVVAKVLFAVIHFFLYRKKQKHAGWRVDHA